MCLIEHRDTIWIFCFFIVRAKIVKNVGSEDKF